MPREQSMASQHKHDKPNSKRANTTMIGKQANNRKQKHDKQANKSQT
jgi:hypothetical protein